MFLHYHPSEIQLRHWTWHPFLKIICLQIQSLINHFILRGFSLNAHKRHPADLPLIFHGSATWSFIAEWMNNLASRKCKKIFFSQKKINFEKNLLLVIFEFLRQNSKFLYFFFRIINNGYSSLPRSSSAQSGFLTPNHHLNYAGSSSVARSRSSASLASEATPKRPSSVASLASSSGTSIRTKTSRPKAKTVNASLSIWQIQKELKRGEMVQVRIF